MKTKKIYKIRDLTTGKYISIGYSNRASWFVFPSAAILSDGNLKPTKNYVVDCFETVVVKSLTLEGKEITNENICTECGESFTTTYKDDNICGRCAKNIFKD